LKKIRITNKELWNLSETLADIIHQYLVAFRAYERHLILYSHDYEKPDFSWEQEHSDDTEWFLDELIWTFKTLAHGDEEVEALTQEVFGGENATMVMESLDFSSIRANPKYEILRNREKEVSERTKKGLELFAKHFGSLWD
jgi:hypothetical protein